ncbi:unnamed protein product [Parascedosporium putredinis]|uniref:DNA/RNA-binding protein Alba-like domain-containing protein n=1 Tax=Parascedosporium putredinis TaxID=1442378 RepID=A0A9P1GWW3_9PEZI|nr:unnamed protein product [Parascedosporium putredinis]CAI7989966.1 unnamed protein product [Parascedosporium putredinis]
MSGDTGAKARTSQPNPTALLSQFHESMLADLKPKYDVAAMSVISSTKIRNRVTRIAEHLRGAATSQGDSDAQRMPLVLVHARPSEVCKMITIIETSKSVLGAEGATVYQYNHLFEVEPRPEHRETIDETELARGGEEEGEVESDDGFEKLQTYEQAANPPKPKRKTNSLAIFLSTAAVPILSGRTGITEQIHEKR